MALGAATHTHAAWKLRSPEAQEGMRRPNRGDEIISMYSSCLALMSLCVISQASSDYVFPAKSRRVLLALSAFLSLRLYLSTQSTQAPPGASEGHSGEAFSFIKKKGSSFPHSYFSPVKSMIFMTRSDLPNVSDRIAPTEALCSE